MASFLSIKSGGQSGFFKRGSRKTENSLVSALERLSTGVRVNSAADDAAALSINNRLTAQLKGARTAIRNIADGASLLQTIESALGESTVALLRARELATRAANEHLIGSDLESIKEEFGELMSHVNTISEQTTFNGINILDGEHHEDLSIQVSETVGETVKLGPLKVDTGSLGRQARARKKRAMSCSGTRRCTTSVCTGRAAKLYAAAFASDPGKSGRPQVAWLRRATPLDAWRRIQSPAPAAASHPQEGRISGGRKPLVQRRRWRSGAGGVGT